MKRFVLDYSIVAILGAETHQLPLRECCGFLLGHSSENCIVASRLVFTRNAENRWDRFAICDYEIKRVQDLGRRLDMALVAVFHTHTSGNVYLSHLDKRSLAYSDLPWIVAALENMEGREKLKFAAYAASSGEEIPLRVQIER
jgi:proteasome lid subunit RPN8/RPN11